MHWTESQIQHLRGTELDLCSSWGSCQASVWFYTQQSGYPHSLGFDQELAGGGCSYWLHRGTAAVPMCHVWASARGQAPPASCRRDFNEMWNLFRDLFPLFCGVPWKQFSRKRINVSPWENANSLWCPFNFSLCLGPTRNVPVSSDRLIRSPGWRVPGRPVMFRAWNGGKTEVAKISPISAFTFETPLRHCLLNRH